MDMQTLKQKLLDKKIFLLLVVILLCILGGYTKKRAGDTNKQSLSKQVSPYSGNADTKTPSLYLKISDFKTIFTPHPKGNAFLELLIANTSYRAIKDFTLSCQRSNNHEPLIAHMKYQIHTAIPGNGLYRWKEPILGAVTEWSCSIEGGTFVDLERPVGGCITQTSQRILPARSQSSWTRIPTEHLDNHGALTDIWASSDEQLLVAIGAKLYRFHRGAWTMEAAPDGISAIFGENLNNIWAVGQNGLLANYDGSHWKVLPSITEEELFAVMGVPSLLWAFGLNETVLRYDGSSWSKAEGVPLHPTKVRGVTLGDSLLSGWASATGQAWFLKPGNNVLHTDGRSWKEMRWLCNDDILEYSVGGIDETPIFISQHAIFSLNQDRFVSLAAYADSEVYNGLLLRTIAAARRDEIWITGRRFARPGHPDSIYSFLVHFDGVSWVEEKSPNPKCWFNIAKVTPGQDIYLAGEEIRGSGAPCIFKKTKNKHKN